jgi:hypothetical protein
MNKRSRLAALLGAGLLTFAVTGIALASTDLLAGQVGITLSEKDATGTDACAGVDVPDGGAVLHFVLTGTSDTDGSLDFVLSNPTTNGHADNASDSNGNTLDWWVPVDSATGDTVLESATTSADGDNLVLSHVCFGAVVTAPPTPVPTPTGGGGGGGESDVPTQPATDSIGSTGNSGPTDTAWLLVVGLGVLLASIVVLTPARAKSRR